MMNTTDLSQQPTSKAALTLGYLGLIPFVGLALAAPVLPQHLAQMQQLMADYTLCILCFLVGSWWGLGLIRRAPSALVLSNVIVIAVWLSRTALLPDQFLYLSALLFIILIVCERLMPLFKPQPTYYRNLRLRLTGVACLALCMTASLSTSQ